MNGGAIRYAVAELEDDHFAVIETARGDVVAFASAKAARGLAALLCAIEPTGKQLEALLGDGPRGRQLLRTVELRSSAPCRRCGRLLSAGAPARWNRASRLVQHPRRCPAPAERRRST